MTAARDRAWAALGTVLDPELDRPVTELGFVQRLDVAAGRAEAQLRLPTYFCAPNFAYLMVADARRALAGLPGVDEVQVTLVDHFASDEINAGSGGHPSFAATFTGLTDETEDADLEELRAAFLRKAHRAAQERLVAALARQQVPMRGEVPDPRAADSLARLAHSTLRDAGDRPQARLVRRRRGALGLDDGLDAPLLLDDQGRRLGADEVVGWLRFAKTVRVSIEANADLCEGLLHTRYGELAGSTAS